MKDEFQLMKATERARTRNGSVNTLFTRENIMKTALFFMIFLSQEMIKRRSPLLGMKKKLNSLVLLYSL